jgi:hypothetical protein
MCLSDKILRIATSVNSSNHQLIIQNLLDLDHPKETIQQIELLLNYDIQHYDGYSLLLQGLLEHTEHRSRFHFSIPFMVLRRLYELGTLSLSDIVNSASDSKLVGFLDVLARPEPSKMAS